MTAQKIIVLGTGGTIAGTAASSSDHTGYTAAQLGVEQLLQSVPGLAQALRGDTLASEQVAQLDSKDMDWATMTRIAQRCAHHLAHNDVRGIVITHGTDTLEETAYFLHLVLNSACAEWMAHKPVVLTCAMRPATSSEADGPRNLHDAVVVARDALGRAVQGGGRARGVLVVCAGDVHHAAHVQKVSTYALNAFASGWCDSGCAALAGTVEENQVIWNTATAQLFKPFEQYAGMEYVLSAHYLIATDRLQNIRWPRVEIVLNHAQQEASIVKALLAASTADDPLRAIVVAGTGNGTVSERLLAALQTAQTQGVEVMIGTRCAWDELPSAADQPLRQPAKARVALMLKLLQTA